MILKTDDIKVVILTEEVIYIYIMCRGLFYLDKKKKMRIELESYLSDSSCTGYNRSNNSPTCVIF